ncbi:MAG: D-glycero-alpha-D-manno-heptose-1,7-bisphosphate 7-phosphatase [Aggregatilineales bacterium]
MAYAVFLDRDGVINRAIICEGRPYPPGNLAELEVLPGVPESLMRLRQAGFYLVVVTNQPDVARGTQMKETVEAMHAILKAQLLLDDFRVCYHDDSADCSCRKPKPGMILDAAAAYNLDLSESFLVGDRWRDIEAGRRAGCKTIFIDYDYAETNDSQPDVSVRSFAEAVNWILQQAKISQRIPD